MPAWIYASTFKRHHVAVFCIGLLPVARLFYLGFHDELSANPIEFITRSTGTWGLIFLCITLSITPLCQISGLNKLISYRRMLGLFAFFYAFLHAAIWFWLDQAFDITAMIQDVVKRPFITMGFISFTLLIPLAISSNRYAIQVLKKRWSQLHHLIYVIGITTVLHYWWHKAGKHDYGTVSMYAAIMVSLLAWRLYRFMKHLIERRKNIF